MENNKRVLWIVTELFPPDETSTAYILGEIANSFVNKYQVKVICGPEIYDKRKKIDKNNLFQLDKRIELYRVNGADLDKNTAKGKALSFLLMSYRLRKLAKAHICKHDKVLMVTNPAPLVVLMGKLKKKVGFELNILVHDVFPENTIPAGINLPAYGFFKHMFDRAYSRADRLIVLGRDMENVIRRKVERFHNKQEIAVIENWADVEGIVPQPFHHDKIILQYAGNIGRVQGLDKIIAQLPENVEFHLYGTGSMEDKLKAMNHPHVFFHGPYFRSQQNEVLASCDIAVVTLQDGMYGLGVPSKTYNILASGRPVMYFGPKDSEIDLLVKEKKVGFCGWPASWSKDDLTEMGMRARELAVKEYSKEIILNKFLNLI